MTIGAVPSAPLWVRAAAAIVGRSPVARYRMTHALRHLAARPFLMRMPAALGGYTFQCDLRDSVAREVCFTGRYEPQETQLASRLVGRGQTVVDVGANWGYFTLAAAHWVGSAGRVVAFEPEPRLFAMLAANVSRNHISHATLGQLAVAAGAGRVGLLAYDEQGGNWGTSQVTAASHADSAGCDAVGLDDHLDGEGVGTVDLLKIDVEGGEADVIEGMQRGLASHRYRYILLECHPDALTKRGTSVSQCTAAIARHGYRVQAIDHTPEAHRRAAAAELPARELLRPFDGSAAVPAWPHFLLSAPGMPEPA